MFRVTWFELFACLMWLVGGGLLIAAASTGEQPFEFVAVLPIAAACVASVLAGLWRLLAPVRESAELAGAVARLNGHRERPRL